MKNVSELNAMTKKEKALLLYLETCAVDHGGLVLTQRMSIDDSETAKKWSESGFIKFGRLASDCLPRPNGATHWCQLSDNAWELAHAERRERYARINSKRKWFTTDEKRDA